MASSSGASTSSAFSRRPSSYDVFINFRGVDTRYNFVYLLNEALRRAGIHVFIDSEELWEGEEICPSLLRAIRHSKISIPVFSQNYANSKYCLLELSKIWESHLSEGQTILPIFIDVEPRDVRHQTGSFQEPFVEHQSKRDSATVESWKNALTKVGNLKGWALKGDATIKEQSDIVELVVLRALRELDDTSLDERKYLVGIDSHVDKLLHLLHIGSNDVRFVAICGMGGLGKTTMAKAVQHGIFRKFNQKSFLTDVREQASQGNKGLVSLQKQLLRDIFKRDYDISIVSQGSKLIEDRLHGENILLILDDVDDHEQLNALAGGPNWFGQGSRVIITTRDVHCLNVHEGKLGNHIQIYEPAVLNDENALQLFNLHAFPKIEPPEKFRQLSRAIVEYADGLPLTLEVLGTFLIDKTKEEWEDTVKKLKDVNEKMVGKSIKEYDDKVFEKLMISYNQLGDDEKTIFLDIAGFSFAFRRYNIEEQISMWEACELGPKLAIRLLIQKHLVKSTHCGLRMHDQLLYMARRIILKNSNGDPTKCSRFWSEDENWKILKEDTGIHMVEGFFLTGEDAKESGTEGVLSWKDFQRMPNLRILQICGIEWPKGDFADLPSKLRWFRWFGSRNIIPPNFYHPEVVYLDLSGIAFEWKGRPQNKNKCFQKLKRLNLTYCKKLYLSPHVSSWFPSLQELYLQDCNGLLELPDSIGLIASLKILSISCCRSLKKLPTSIGSLRNLVKLSIMETAIEELPNGVGQLEKLEELYVSKCNNLVKLPTSMGRMRSLLRFNLEGTRIENFPDDFSKLSSLKEFTVAFQHNWADTSVGSLPELPSNLIYLKCHYLKSLVNLADYTRLKKLRRLDVGDCENLVEIHFLKEAESLEELRMKRFHKLREFPDLSNLKNLRKLDVSGCKSLEEIHCREGTESLKELIVKECDELREFPDLSNLKKLRKLCVIDCGNLEEIHCREGTESLEQLVVNGCYDLRELPDFSKLKKLRILDVGECKNLEEIHCREGTESLEGLTVAECRRLRELPDLSKLKNLRKLKVYCCSSLEEIHCREGTESLEELMVKVCDKLRELPDLSKLKKLRILDVGSCGNLEEIHCREGTESLDVLLVNKCNKLRELPDLSKLKKLRILYIWSCENLEEIHCREGAESLEGLTLTANGCDKLREFPDLSKLENLRKLHVGGCGNLEEIHCLEGTESLEELTVTESSEIWTTKGCNRLRELPDLSKLKNLRKLDVSGCKSLEEIHCREGTESLKELIVKECDKLREFPDLSNLKKLRKLCVIDCGNLEEIHCREGTESLEQLVVNGCYDLRELPDFSKLKKLRILDVGGCGNLEEIHCLEGTESLEELTVKGCHNLRELLDLSKLKQLRKFVVSGCGNLEEIHCLEETESLEELTVDECNKLRELPDLSKLKKLTKLDVGGCGNLEEIHCLEGTESLEELTVKGCDKLTPDLSKLKKLRKLNVSGCRSLEEIHCCEGIESLEELAVNGCNKLREIPDLSKLKKLRILHVWHCGNLEEIHCREGTESLEVLLVNECNKLRELPDLSKLKKLRELDVSSCRNLEEIHCREGTESLEEVDAFGCSKLTETTRKICGQGTLLANVDQDQLRSLSYVADDALHHGSPILCVVFSEPFETVDLVLTALIRWGVNRTTFHFSIRIEDFNFTHDCLDVIYMHHFNGFPFDSKAAIEKLKVELGHSEPSWLKLKFLKLLFENNESGQQLLDQQSGAMLVAEFFRWSEDDEEDDDDDEEDEEMEEEQLDTDADDDDDVDEIEEEWLDADADADDEDDEIEEEWLDADADADDEDDEIEEEWLDADADADDEEVKEEECASQEIDFLSRFRSDSTSDVMEAEEEMLRPNKRAHLLDNEDVASDSSLSLTLRTPNVKESGQRLLNEQSGAVLVAEFFRWSDAEERASQEVNFLSRFRFDSTSDVIEAEEEMLRPNKRAHLLDNEDVALDSSLSLTLRTPNVNNDVQGARSPT